MIKESTNNQHLDQLERAKRYLQRMEEIYEGKFSSTGHDAAYYDDDVITFFLHCYHVRDWIISSGVLGSCSVDIDHYINEHLPLRICADIANGAKHCVLTRRTRSGGEQPSISGKERDTSVWLTASGGGEVMKSSYAVSAVGKEYDSLLLARECIGLWDKFLRSRMTDDTLS